MEFRRAGRDKEHIGSRVWRFSEGAFGVIRILVLDTGLEVRLVSNRHGELLLGRFG